MKITKMVPSSISRKVAGQVLTLKQNSPHIMFGVGVVGVITGTVLACRATLRAGDVLDEMHESVEAVKRDMQDVDGYKKDVAYAYGVGSVRLVRLYAPAVVVTGVSIAALTGSHIALTKRNNALTAAYTGLHAAYENYRERVREELGEEKELDIYHGATVEKVKVGNKNETRKTVDPNKISPYARFFDETSTEYRNNAEMNRLYITAQQNYFNNILHARGFVFLNEVYEALGLPWCDAGQVVGWVLSDEGDNYIDFGIYNAYNSKLVNGSLGAEQPGILLDFNVDGVVYGKLG